MTSGNVQSTLKMQMALLLRDARPLVSLELYPRAKERSLTIPMPPSVPSGLLRFVPSSGGRMPAMVRWVRSWSGPDEGA